MKKSPTTDRLDDIIRKINKLIDIYQGYERGLTQLIPFARNYVNKKYISENLKEVQDIKEKFKIISTVFKEFKKVHRKEFDNLMQEYLDKHDEYHEAVMYSINKRIILQNALLNKKGTLLGYFSLIRIQKNSVNNCMQSALEINKIVAKIKQKG
ncbi:MAG: hypothetical protein D3923_09690 [Candidatus Electrothrix sp. AR3]|nr:hypothetical protein [Candidatus Electrothrix sp. AR3]